MADDVFSIAFGVLRDERNAHRAHSQNGGGRRDRGSRGARQVPNSQDSTEAAGFDAPGRMLEFLRHYQRPAPGGGSGREGVGQSSKKKRKTRSGGATPQGPPPKKYPSVDDQFFSDS